MRVLFSLLSTSHLKNFEPVVDELARRGHDVHLVFHETSGWRGADDLAEELSARSPHISLAWDPVPPDGWLELSLTVAACRDYLQFAQPRYSEVYRARAEARVPKPFKALADRPVFRTRFGGGALATGLRLAASLLPPGRELERYMEGVRPHVALFTPFVGLRTAQPSWLKAARAGGARTAVCVGSWDHLTTKSLIRPLPDLVTVWNDTQAREATNLHAVPSDRIAITGAQPFDHWFTWTARPREVFCRRVGLDPARPFVLYTCFTPFKRGANEAEFVRGWIERMRSSDDDALRTAGVIVRPHPKRMEVWHQTDVSDLADVVVWPTEGRQVADAETKADFYDSIAHSAAVVGINTSAMIEAGIVGRPVHTILAPEFHESQQGTFHFHYLMEVGGGLLRVARDLDEHVRQLSESVRGGYPDGANRSFVEAFVRPHGIEHAATPRFIAAIEQLAETGRSRSRLPRLVSGSLRFVGRPAARRAELARARRSARKRQAALVKRATSGQASALLEARAERPFRILVATPATSDLRWYLPALELLARRGHRVHLGFERITAEAELSASWAESAERIDHYDLARRPVDCVLTVESARCEASRAHTELARRARELGIPVVTLVGGGTSPSLQAAAAEDVDAVIVPRRSQQREVVERFAIGPERVMVGGAPVYDTWFDMRPRLSRSTLQLPARPYLLYVRAPSGAADADQELALLRQWIEALRRSESESVRGFEIVIATHHDALMRWTVKLDRLERVTCQGPPERTSDNGEEWLFHALHFSAGAVSPDAALLVEAAILAKPVLVLPPLRPDDRELAGKEYPRWATSMEDHVDQLAAALSDPASARKAAKAFARSVARPHGLEHGSGPIVVDAIETLTAARRT
jgi:hypothetical protein